MTNPFNIMPASDGWERLYLHEGEDGTLTCSGEPILYWTEAEGLHCPVTPPDILNGIAGMVAVSFHALRHCLTGKVYAAHGEFDSTDHWLAAVTAEKIAGTAQ